MRGRFGVADIFVCVAGLWCGFVFWVMCYMVWGELFLSHFVMILCFISLVFLRGVSG